ncbi:MAG: long-chain fatty acid--CoA ligase [Cytophagales bacterium]|nr:MAG: long-chain fatty acid--CoA ligase [Cytophagales bacterium]
MEPNRLFDLISYQLEKYPNPDALSNKVNGVWVKYSTEEYQRKVDQLSKGLLKFGIEKEDKIAIISHNRPEWNFIDMAVQQIGAISVPMYPTITEADFKFIFQDAEVKLIFVSDADLYQKAKNASREISAIKNIFTFNEIDGASNYKELIDEDNSFDATLNERKASVKAEDVVTLIYTSGTTGNPKGVMLTHQNMMTNVKASAPLMPVDYRHKALSFLPLCHVYERMLNYLYLYCGVSIYYAESLETISDNLKEVKPNIFVTVPRLLEKVYDKIYAKGAELKGIKKLLFFWALELGLKFDTSKDQGWWYNFQLKIANKLIFSKWREALGGNVRAIVSGGAALQPRLGRVFWAAQITILEGYGLTETSPVIAVNRAEPKDNRISTVGLILPGVDVKIAQDGEILAKGPNIMKGYYKRPDLTAEVIDSDGWFHTGDIGEFVEGRFLKITDRKKEMFKTSGGKYIAPQLIENKLKESRMIEQTMVIGDGKKYPAAIIIPSFVDLKNWCEIKNISFSSPQEMVSNKHVLEKYQREINEINENFAQYEKIKKFILLPQLWTVDSGEMTPKLSLKRKIIFERNLALIEKLYED